MHEELLEVLLTNVPHINHKVAKDWVENVIIETERDLEESGEILSEKELEHRIEKTVRWHIRRLNGIGGSDMAVFYTEHKGGFYPFEGTDSRSVVAQKLCLTTPGISNGDTERGRETEKVAMRKFLAKMKKSGRPLKMYPEGYEALNKLEENGGVPDYPWMKSSPDGIFMDEDGKVWLVDFKTPASEDALLEMVDNPPDYYRAQLAQYKYHLEAAGIKVDHVCLVPFSTKRWTVDVSEFKISPDLMNDVLQAGDKYWTHVLNNELPPMPQSKNFEYVAEMPKELQQIVAEFVLVKKMMSILDKKDKSNKRKLLDMVSLMGVDWNQPDKKTRIPGVDISTKGKVTTDYKKMVTDIKAGKEVDPDSEEYKRTSDTVTASVIRGKKNAHASWIEEIEVVGDRSIKFAHEDVFETNGFEITDLSIKNLVQDPTSPLFGISEGEVEQFFDDVGYKVTKTDVQPVSSNNEEQKVDLTLLDGAEPIF